MDLNQADDVRAFAVLLHPHPDYGGNRFHPFIDSLFHRLPGIGIAAVRFDFSSADPAVAAQEAVAAIDEGAARWQDRPAVLAGYSFGAGIASTVGDTRLTGWYLLAPPVMMLSQATIGKDPRPKMIAMPEHDQFSPLPAVKEAVSGWDATTVAVLTGTDHFLGPVEPIVDGALGWMGGIG